MSREGLCTWYMMYMIVHDDVKPRTLGVGNDPTLMTLSYCTASKPSGGTPFSKCFEVLQKHVIR